MGQFTFSKKERLSSEKDIQELFKKGSSFYLFPFKILFLSCSASAGPHQVLISVSKKNFKTAPDRNRIKRRLREGYRLNKHILPPAYFLKIGFIYTHKEILPGPEISEKMVHALRKLSRLAKPQSEKP
jgi:ribonuclease P protein component